MFSEANDGTDSNEDEFKEEYDELHHTVGSVNPLDEIEIVDTKNEKIRQQGYTEKWTGLDSNGTWQSAFRNPKTGKFTGGHESSRNWR